MGFVENSLTAIWNSLLRRNQKQGLKIGLQVKDGQLTRKQIVIPHFKRQQHIAIVGKTGTGKSNLLKFQMSQDIAAGRGFICVDLHGDLIPFLLASLAAQEQQIGKDLSAKLVIIDPGHPSSAVGLNLIDCQESASPAVQISEMVNLLKVRWSLDHFGARTEELLRNSLWALCENRLTLLELSPFLTSTAYRSSLLAKVTKQDVKAYFEERYERTSEAMQSVMREAVLNKMTTFTVDSAIRHIVGQQSSFSMQSAVDQGFWILLNLRKGRLGDNALTLPVFS